MKKSLLAILMLMTLAVSFTGCKKDEDEDDGKGNTSENTWTVDGSTFQLVSSLAKPSFTGATLSAAGTDGTKTSVLSIEFSKKPTTSGSFAVKSFGTDLSDSDVIITSIGEGALFYSTGKSGDVAKVTVSGGKVRVEISKIEIEFASGSGSTKGSLSANILEN